MARLMITLLTLTLLAAVSPTLPARADTPRQVKVERTRPEKKQLATLRFLRENRDFLRGRIDGLRETPLDLEGAGLLDPALLERERLMAEIAGAFNALAALGDGPEQDALLASLEEIAALEADLARLESLLAAEEERLGAIEMAFAREQQTLLLVVVSGLPEDAPAQLSWINETGDAVHFGFTGSTRTGLVAGGLARVFHDFVEPREQTWEVVVDGGAWTVPESAFITLTPALDRVTVLRLDLGGVAPTEVPETLHAEAWITLEPEPMATESKPQ